MPKRLFALGGLAAVALGTIIALGVFRTEQPSVVFDPPAPRTASSASTHIPSSFPVLPSSSLSSSSSFSSFASSSSSSFSLPPSVRIRVPFGVQAPYANWNPPYDEACEEASLVLVKAFLDGESAITPDEMDRRILELVAREKDMGLPIDITIEELARVAEETYGLRATLTANPSIEDIKRALAAGTPVIVPLAGRDLGNPYYSGAGPWYHVLVITGYDAKYFYTQDVGTRRGEDYKYRQDVLHDAIHDWTGVKEEIRQGAKVMLTLRRAS